MSQAGTLLVNSLPGAGVFTLTADVGGPVPPTLGNINIFGGANINTAGNAGTSTITVNLNDFITWPDTNAAGTQGVIYLSGNRFLHDGGDSSNTWLGTNAGNFTVTGTLNTGIGVNALSALTTGSLNVAVGANALQAQTTASSNVAIGNNSMFSSVTGGGNVAIGDTSLFSANGATGNIGIGFDALFALTTGLQNVVVGFTAGVRITTGQFNIAIGGLALNHVTTNSNNIAMGVNCLLNATGSANTVIGSSGFSGLLAGSNNIGLGSSVGSNYAGAESSNIIIGNAGVLGESNVIRIGTTGGGAAQQNKCFVGGINGAATAGATVKAVIIDNLDQLAASNIILAQWNSVLINTNMVVNNGYIPTTVGLITFTLPAVANVGSTLRIAGFGAGGWKIAQNAAQQIHLGAASTTVGVPGSLASTNRYDCIELLCILANTEWVTLSVVGNITVV